MAIFAGLRAHFYSPTNWETFNLKEFGILDDNYSVFFEKRLKEIVSLLKREIVLSDTDIFDE